jgi:hypothetical protein
MPTGSEYCSEEGQLPHSLTTFGITGKLASASLHRLFALRQTSANVLEVLRKQRRTGIADFHCATQGLGFKGTRNTPKRADRHHFGRENLLTQNKSQFMNQNNNFES